MAKNPKDDLPPFGTEDAIWDEDGGPAFPAQSPESYFSGMSLRDYFAAKVLAGAVRGVENLDHMTPEQRAERFDKLADLTYQIADAMLKVRTNGTS